MPTTRFKNTVYRAMLPFCAPSCSNSPISSVSGRPLVARDRFVRLIRKHHVLGSATLLSNGHDQSLIFTDSEKPTHHPGPDTYFRVASITKIATAVLIMHLSDRGLLSLDAPVSSCLPLDPLPDELSGVTLRHLLSHTSGLMDPPTLEKDLESGRTIPEVVSGTRRSLPGDSFRYSNLGYGIIGCVIEAVTGRPLDLVFNDELFSPLGMDATLSGCTLPMERIMPVTRILPYHEGNDLILTPLGKVPLVAADPLRHFGHTAGSMYTTVQSLQKLLNVLILNENGFLSPSTLEEMKKQHASYGSLSPTLSYGLGLLQIRDPRISSSRVLGHQGFAYGCGDGAFWEEKTGRLLIFLNGGCSEARSGRLGSANRDFMIWAFRKELPSW